MKVLRSAVTGMVLLACSPGLFGGGQMGQAPTQRQQQLPRNPGLPPIDGRPSSDEDALPPSILARQERMRNDDRQKQLVDDTNKLLELATELKAEVGKTNKNVMSVDVIKKADQIEKLAKSVKDRMKG